MHPDDFADIIEANYPVAETLVNPTDRRSVWTTFIAIVQAGETIGTDAVTRAMSAHPLVKASWGGDITRFSGWVLEHANDPSDEWWDHTLEASRLGLDALRLVMRAKRIPRLSFFAQMPWGEFIWTQIPAFPEGYMP